MLTYALTCSYNSIIACNESWLLQKLKISFIPRSVFKGGYFTKTAKGIVSKLTTKEPQSYFLNDSWLYDYEKLTDKIIYLHALSQRSISDKNFFIPDNYLEEKYWNNPFLKHRDGKIWFLPELKQLKPHKGEIRIW